MATGQHGALNKDAGSTSLADHRNCEAARPLGAACFVVVRRGLASAFAVPTDPSAAQAWGREIGYAPASLSSIVVG